MIRLDSGEILTWGSLVPGRWSDAFRPQSAGVYGVFFSYCSLRRSSVMSSLMMSFGGNCLMSSRIHSHQQSQWQHSISISSLSPLSWSSWRAGQPAHPQDLQATQPCNPQIQAPAPAQRGKGALVGEEAWLQHYFKVNPIYCITLFINMSWYRFIF